jgi:putative membrane protein
MKQQFTFFLIRWLINSVAIWVAVVILATGDFATSNAGLATFLLAGLIFSVVNVLLRPVLVILSLPAILLTLGLFMLVINGIMVYVALALIPSIDITFIGAILAGMIVSLTNYVLSSIIESYRQKRSHTHAGK